MIFIRVKVYFDTTEKKNNNREMAEENIKILRKS